MVQHKQDSLNNLIFQDLIHNNRSKYVRKYTSATTNKDLENDSSWNLLYSKEVKSVVDKIENYCKVNGNISKLNDLFIIRNGLILINDSVFILKEGKELKVENNQFYIQVNGKFFKLNESERNRLKTVYKSKSIIPYGYFNEDYVGYILYFNKNEFGSQSVNKRNKLLEKKYPSLTKYLNQFEDELRETLINAKENPHDLYYPRRGSFIRKIERDSKGILVDLEPLYEQNQKIFFKYISTKNIFGFTADPYYATSDTYFLWPKSAEKSINYPFIIAYLNSSLVSFLYKAKNITIKRSKTKLEYGLPIPNIRNFMTEEKSKIINLIENLVVSLIGDINSNPSKKAYNDKHNIQRTIDSLFFQLFDLDVKNISKLLEN